MKYTEIPITLSKKKYKDTDEYKQLKNELLNKLDNGEITMAELNKQLEELLIKIGNYMDVKRKTNKGRVFKKVEDISELAILDKTEEILSKDDITDVYEFIYNDYRILLPNENFLKEYYDKMINNVNYIEEEKPLIYSYFSLSLGNSGAFNCSTRKIPLYDNEDMINQMELLVAGLLENLPGYGNTEKPPEITKIVFTLTLGDFKDITNWWKREVKQKIKFKDFTLFTANNKDIDCKQQCIEFLGGKWDSSKSFEEMLNVKEIIYYKPINGIRNVRCLNDLVTSGTAINTNNNDCKNVARIIIDSGHMGVICNIKTKEFSKRRVQSKKLIKNEISNTLEVFIDIESFTENTNSLNKKQIPYLICWSTNENNEIKKRSGKDCIRLFINDILKLSRDNKKVILYAWYGSGYDYQHILPYIKEYSTSEKIVIKNNSIIYAEFNFELLELKIIFKDPYLFMLASLDKSAKAFNVLNKGSFPHTIIKDWDNLEKIYPNWVKIQHKIIEQKTDNKIGLIVNKEEVINYENETNYKTVLEKAIEYCSIDVQAMKEVWNKFRKLVREALNMEINDDTFTLSQLSMKLMQSYLENGVELHVPTTDDYDFLKDGIYGGRVIAKNGIYKEEIIYADVVSLYPSTMKLLKHAYGNPEYVDKINWNLHGVYKVKLIHKDDEEPMNYMKFVPRRIDGRLTWEWFKEHTGVYHTYDLLIAKEEGFNIEIIKGIEYQYIGYIYNKYIDTLYSLKEDHSNCNCEQQPCSIRHIAKIALNGGGYGKFVQKPIEKDIYIVKRDIIAGEFDKIKEDENGYINLNNNKIKKPEFYNLDGDKYDKMIIETVQNPIYATQNGISILSGSRYRLYNLCKSFNGIDVLYSDTDSIFIRKRSINYDYFKTNCGTDLGMLDESIKNSKDNTINKLIICGPKMYGYQYTDIYNKINTSIYCKGVPKDMINLKHLETIIKENKEIQYVYIMLRKKLTTVDERKIEKNIGETIKGLRI